MTIRWLRSFGFALIAALSLLPGTMQVEQSAPRSRFQSPPQPQAQSLPYARMAAYIVKALQPAKGERVILRYDPEMMPALESEVRKALQKSNVVVESLRYGLASDFEQKLNRADVYVWLPASPAADTPEDQEEALARWLDAGKGRQVHFHWSEGTRGADGLPGVHSMAYDRVYLSALDINCKALDKQMETAMAKLKSGEVRVTTPAGTDIRFRVGDRPFCKQNGDASKAHMASARIRVDREIELPAGALRVAPLEESINGVMIISLARIGDAEVKDVRLEFKGGVVTKASAASHEDALQRHLASDPGLTRFREFGLGFNPKLVIPSGERWIPYYGYGAGVVRLSLGDNTELGGQVRGGPVRWFFFPDATVRVGNEVLVDKGRLVLSH